MSPCPFPTTITITQRGHPLPLSHLQLISTNSNNEEKLIFLYKDMGYCTGFIHYPQYSNGCTREAPVYGSNKSFEKIKKDAFSSIVIFE